MARQSRSLKLYRLGLSIRSSAGVSGPCAATPSSKFKQKRLGAKLAKDLERLESKGEELQDEDATLYRALAARTNYLAFDMPDLEFATKELCRDVVSPTAAAVKCLKRFVRDLAGKPRHIWVFKRQA